MRSRAALSRTSATTSSNGASDPSYSTSNVVCDTFVNFLENPTYILTNVRVNTVDKNIHLKNFPIGKYATLQVILYNTVSCVSEIFPLVQDSPKVRDLRMKSNLKVGVPFCEKRAVKVLMKN